MTTRILYFLGGVAATVLAHSAGKNPKARELCVKGLAAGMKATEKAKTQLQLLREGVEDMCAEAKALNESKTEEKAE